MLQVQPQEHCLHSSQYQVFHLTCHLMQINAEMDRCVDPGLQQRQQLATLLAQLPFKVLWKLQDEEVARLDLGSNTKVPIPFCCILFYH